MIVNIVNEWQIATAVNGNEINVRIVPHVRKQTRLMVIVGLRLERKFSFKLVKKLS